MSESGRKRNRDPLGDRAGENRCKEISQAKNCYLSGSLSLRVPTPTETHERVEKSRKASAVSHGEFVTPQKIRSDSASSSSLEVHATPEYYKARKMAIYYQFLLYGAPEEEQWVNVNLINTIMINLCIPRGNNQRVRKVLLDCLQSIHLNMEYNPATKITGRSLRSKNLTTPQMLFTLRCTRVCLIRRLLHLLTWQECGRVWSWYAAAPCRTSSETVKSLTLVREVVLYIQMLSWSSCSSRCFAFT